MKTAVPTTGWLTLTRRMGEGVRVGDDVFVVIGKKGSNDVSVYIHAPKAVNIVRLELLEDGSERHAAKPAERGERDERA